MADIGPIQQLAEAAERMNPGAGVRVFERGAANPGLYPSAPSITSPLARFLNRFPWLVLGAGGIYLIGTHFQDVTAALGWEKVGDIPVVGWALKKLGFNGAAEISLGAKNSALLGEFEAKGAKAGALSPEAKAALDKLPPAEKAQMMARLGLDATQDSKSPGQIEGELLTKGKSLAESKEQLVVKGAQISTVDKAQGEAAQGRAQANEWRKIAREYGIGIGPGLKTFAQAGADGTLEKIANESGMSLAEIQAGMKTITATAEAQQTSQLVLPTKLRADADAQFAGFKINLLKSLGYGGLVPDANGNTAPGSTGPKITPDTLRQDIGGTLFGAPSH